MSQIRELRATARYSEHTLRVRAPSAPPIREELLTFDLDAIVEIAPYPSRWFPLHRPARCFLQDWDSADGVFVLE